MFDPKVQIRKEAGRIRGVCERIFADDTRAPRRPSLPPSSGHCAVVALLVRELLGGDLRAITHPSAGPHWFVRVRGVDDSGSAWALFVDLTIDQFALPDRLMVGEADPWPCLLHRNPGEPKSGLSRRFELFRERYRAAMWDSCLICGRQIPPGGHGFCSPGCAIQAGGSRVSGK